MTVPPALERVFAAHVANYEHVRRSALPLTTAASAQHEPAPLLGPAEQRLLWLLSDGEKRTLKQISEELHLEQSTVNRQANAALAHGIVTRTRERGGAYRFSPTADGTARLEASLAELFVSYRHAFDRMGDAAARQFVTLLGEFVEAYTASGDPHRTDATNPA